LVDPRCADTAALLETHHPRRRPLWALSLPARESWLRRADTRTHRRRKTVHGNMCWLAGAVPRV
jgi:hypothetical protein